MGMVVKDLKNYERTITTLGNVLGVAIPQDLLKEVGMKKGDKVSLVNEGGKIVVKRERKVELPEGISEDFFDMVENTFERYEETLKGLANR